VLGRAGSQKWEGLEKEKNHRKQNKGKGGGVVNVKVWGGASCRKSDRDASLDSGGLGKNKGNRRENQWLLL